MTKDQEIQKLREFVRQLGPETYTGPWLEHMLPLLENAIRADHLPEPVALRASAGIIDEAKASALAIVKAAESESAIIVSNAHQRAEIILGRAAGQLRTALATLNA